MLLWSLAEFVPGRPQFKSSATRENSQLFASYQLGFLILLCYIRLFHSNNLSGVHVNWVDKVSAHSTTNRGNELR